MLKFLIVVIAIGAFAYYAYISFDNAFGYPAGQDRACTMEAKLCKDGSSVGRTGPHCEFATCPGE